MTRRLKGREREQYCLERGVCLQDWNALLPHLVAERKGKYSQAFSLSHTTIETNHREDSDGGREREMKTARTSLSHFDAATQLVETSLIISVETYPMRGQ